MANNNRVRFIRVRGRIVPIREKAKDGAVAGAGGAGALVALDAARTKTVYKTKKMTIDRKLFSFLPMDSFQSKLPKFGTGLVAKDKSGNKLGRMLFTVDKKEAEGVIDWLSVNKAARGKGVSKKLARQGAREMVASGAKEIFSHVVHPRSAALLEGEKGVKSTYYRVTRTTRKSGMFLEEIGKGEALKKAGMWKGKPGKFSLRDVPKALGEHFKYRTLDKAAKYRYDYAGPTIYRQVKLPATMRRQIKPFRSFKNKFSMGIGAAVAIGAAAYLLNKRGE